jgi:hypothetical protein
VLKNYLKQVLSFHKWQQIIQLFTNNFVTKKKGA